MKLNSVFLSHLVLFFKNKLHLKNRVCDEISKCKTNQQLECVMLQFSNDISIAISGDDINLKGQISDLEKEKSDLEGEITDLESEVSDLEEKVSDLEEEKDEVESEFNEYIIDVENKTVEPFKNMVDNMKFEALKNNINKFNLVEFEKLMK